MLSGCSLFTITSKEDGLYFFETLYPLQRSREERYEKKADQFSVRGYCPRCGDVDLHVDYLYSPDHVVPIWRERGICRCGLNTRMRSTLDWLINVEDLSPNSLLYCTEGMTPFFSALLSKFPLSIGAEFVPQRAKFGDIDPHGLRCENLEALSMPEESFDGLISLDVLEHVFDYQAALKNIYRVLKPGAFACITVPFLFSSDTTVCRAKLSKGGEVKHLKDPVYHGDPISNAGSLLVYDYGWDLVKAICQVGFTDCKFIFIWSESKKYFGINYILRLKK